jgi:hypothetical protein
MTDAELLARAAAALLPGGPGAPAVPSDLPRPVAAALRRALDALGAGAEVDALGDAERDALLLVLAAAHYADPGVRAAVGYPGPRAIDLPPLPDARDAGLEPLLQRVRDRGPTYRATSPSPRTASSQ